MKKLGLLPLVLIFFLFPITCMSQDIKEMEELSVQVEKKDATGEAAGNGSIKLQITGGTPPFTFTCFNPYSDPQPVKGTELKLTNLKSGNYLFVIQDSSGKIATREVLISNNR